MNIKNNNFKNLLLGAFLILVINLLLSIILFISKIFAIYILKDIYMINYIFGILVICIILYEVSFLRRFGQFKKSILNKAVVLLIFLYLLNFLFTYIEGSIIARDIPERFQKEEFIFYQFTFQYPSLIFNIHNFILIVFSFLNYRNK